MLCWLLFSTILLVYSVPGTDSAASIRLCGAHLADFLALVCKDRGYNEPYANHRLKRSLGIVDECCKRPCSLRVWQSYCAQPGSSVSNSPSGESSSNIISDSGDGEKGQGHQAQVRAEGHRPTTNRCSCRKTRKKLSRKQLKFNTQLKSKRSFEVGTITPYYENNKVISAIEPPRFFVKLN